MGMTKDTKLKIRSNAHLPVEQIAGMVSESASEVEYYLKSIGYSDSQIKHDTTTNFEVQKAEEIPESDEIQHGRYVSQVEVEEIQSLYKEGMSIRAISKKVRRSISTIHKIVKLYQQEKQNLQLTAEEEPETSEENEFNEVEILYAAECCAVKGKSCKDSDCPLRNKEDDCTTILARYLISLRNKTIDSKAELETEKLDISLVNNQLADENKSLRRKLGNVKYEVLEIYNHLSESETVAFELGEVYGMLKDDDA